MLVCRLVSVFLLLLASVAFATAVFATDTPPTGHAIGSAGFNEMLGKQLGSDSLKTEQLPDGSFKLTNTVQTVSAHIHQEGVSFDSIGNSQGKGGFTLQLTQWGREGKLQPVVSSSIYSKDNIVYHTHNHGLAEKFSNTSDGIRQDFIVATKPQGSGSLLVQLKVSDASVQQKGNGAVIALNSGRKLTYDRLAVTDANGKTIPAQIVVANNNVINVIVDDATANYPLTIDPTVGDENWVSMGGVSGIVYASAYYGNSLYIGGSFEVVDDVVANYIAKWDGTGWKSLGSGMDGDVFALAVDDSGNLYAAGLFSVAGGVSASQIAKWDGSTWSALGGGLTGYDVLALAVDSNGHVYAGGNFSGAGGVSANRIAKWDGSSWSALDSGMNGLVLALAVDDSDILYAGGSFTTAGGISANRIAKWDGSTWSALGSGINGVSVYALVLDGNGNLYVGGNFPMAGEVSASNIAKWDGSVWSALGFWMDGFVSALVIDGDNNLYIGGDFLWFVGGMPANGIAKWDGSNWSVLGSGINNWVSTLAVDGSGNLYAGGDFTMAGGKVSADIAQWLTSGHVTNNLDSDNDSDLLTRSSSLGTWTRHTIQNAAITGTGSMNAYTSSSVQYVAQLDANGDGDADILTRNTSNGAWYLHQVQSGAVTSTAPIYLYANLDQQFIGTGDFNGDGTDDVMLRSTSGGYYTVFLLSNHSVNSTVFYNAWTAASSVPQGIGDFDGDGTDDLLVRRTSDNLYFIFKTANGGAANVTCACNLWANPDWAFQFAGDTNKDGTDDIVIRGTGASADGKWWNFRMSNFTSAETTNLNTFLNKTQVSFAASGDYDADGHTDMLIRVNNGPVYVARIVNGLVSGSTTLLSNLPVDQVVLK